MEEVANPIVTALSVHVEPVVALDVEGLEGLPGAVGDLVKVAVEQLLPGCSMNPGRGRDHPIQVEEDRVELTGRE